MCISHAQVDGMKVVDVREAMRFSRDYALRNGPIVIEVVTYRYFGHSMSDPGVGYRTREEIKSVQSEQDPIMLFRQLVVQKGLMTEEEIQVTLGSSYIFREWNDLNEHKRKVGRRNTQIHAWEISRLLWKLCIQIRLGLRPRWSSDDKALMEFCHVWLGHATIDLQTGRPGDGAS